jgi:hypothetical protein
MQGSSVPYERRTVKPNVFGIILVGALASTAVIGAGVVAPGVAHAQAKPKVTRACGVSALPLSVGNQWTYDGVGAPAERQLAPAAARMAPPLPKKVSIQVTSVETQGDVTIVTLAEDTDGRVINTTIKCGATKFEIDPNSFFFAAEPGGSWNVALNNLQHKGNSLQLKAGRLSGPEWRSDILASWERTATANSGANLGKGSLEMERRFVFGGDFTLILPAGQFVAREVTVEITGRVTMDPPAEKPFEMPANFRASLWFTDGTGIVQAINGFAHMYILTSSKISK